jgi:hypothetical protein
MWVLPVPLLPSVMTFSRRSTYAQRAGQHLGQHLAGFVGRQEKAPREAGRSGLQTNTPKNHRAAVRSISRKN